MAIKKINLNYAISEIIEQYLDKKIDSFATIKFKENIGDNYLTISIDYIVSLISGDTDRYVKIECSFYIDGKFKKQSKSITKYIEILDGLYFEYKEDYKIKVYTSFTENVSKFMKVLEDKKNYIDKKVLNEGEYVNNLIYHTDLTHRLEFVTLLYVLLLNNYIRGSFTKNIEILKYLKNKFEYFGYTDVENKPDDVYSLEDKTQLFLYYVTTKLFTEDEIEIDRIELEERYEEYIDEYSWELVSKELR